MIGELLSGAPFAAVALAAAPLAGAALGGIYLAFDLAVLPALDHRAHTSADGPVDSPSGRGR